MSKEQIVAFNGIWYHIFFKPSHGLCVSKKSDARFTFSECILPNAFDDFYAAATENALHVVCQNESGAVLHFTFDGKTWSMRRLLESRDKMPEFKNLTLMLIGNFVNLFYVIHSKNNYILVHQLLGEAADKPKAVDDINGTDFSVCNHSNGDLSLLYRNSDKLYGTKRFRWSRKDFDGFCPLDCGCNFKQAVISADCNDNLQIAAYAVFDKFVNILFLTKNAVTSECAMSAVHLVSGESEELALSEANGSLSISWCENGLVMTTSLFENKWSVPKKYIRGTTQKNVLYHVQSETESFFTYGYRQNGRIMLYLTQNILDQPPSGKAKQHHDILKQNFAISQEHGMQERQSKQKNIFEQKTAFEHPSFAPEYVRRSVYSADMAALRNLLKSQNDMIVEMLKKITALERAALEEHKSAEDMKQMNQSTAENTEHENRS